jgi:hypothetical protein
MLASHLTLVDSPLIASMQTLASLSTTMSWKFSDIAILMAQAMAVALAMHGSRKGDLLAQHFRIELEELDFSI